MRRGWAPDGGWEIPDGRGPHGFWSPLDWWTTGATTLAALLVYLLTLAPSVVLEDSAGLSTAAWNFGVARAPGHPVWLLVAWWWTHVLPVGNVAWRLNLLSALWGAVAAGLMALLVARSARVLAVRLVAQEESFQHRLVVRASALGGAVAGGMLAFGPAFWSQAVVAEVHTMSACIFLAVLVGLFRWSFEPERRFRLYLAAFLWGLGAGVHPTLLLGGGAFAFFVWLVERSVGRDLLVLVLGAWLVGVCALAVWPGSVLHQGAFSAATLGGLALAAAVGLFFLCRPRSTLMRQWRAALGVMGAALLGLVFYAVVPAAAQTHAPVNGILSRFWTGFLGAAPTAGLTTFRTERSLLELWAQLNGVLYNVQAQFNIVFAVFGLAVWFFFRELTRFGRDWLWFLLTLFGTYGCGFIFLSNPPYERAWTFSSRVFLLPMYAVYAFWIGYSAVLLSVFVLRRWVDWQPRLESWLLLVLGFPLVSLAQHHAASSQRHHHFHYGFGYRFFKPGAAYPEMEPDAILLAHSPSGCFAAAYLLSVESRLPARLKTHLAQYPDSVSFERRDVYLIAAGALADPHYLRQLHRRYGTSRLAERRSEWFPPKPIWLPSEADWQQALEESAAQLGLSAPEREQASKSGALRNAGLLHAQCAAILRRIFEQNRQRHPFYVEGEWLGAWMTPYLEPYGLILRLNPQPLPVMDPATVGRDRRYWDELTRHLLEAPGFEHDVVARAVYSRARAGIAALYVHHGLYEDAEHAYRQALQLSPDNHSASLSLARLYLQQERFEEALQCLLAALERDSYNASLRDAIVHARERQQIAARIRELQSQRAERPGDLPLALQLLTALARAQRLERMDQLAAELLSLPTLTAADFLQMAEQYGAAQRPDRAVQVLQVCLQRFPNHALAWYELAAHAAAAGNCSECLAALSRALSLEPPPGRLRTLARQDLRLKRCREDPTFQRVLGAL